MRGVRARLKQALLRVFFTDKVRPFIWVYYAALFIWGIYGTFFSAPATYVKPVMGHLIYDLWVWLQIAGPAMIAYGMWLEWRSHTDDECDTPMERVAVQIQTGVHACMFFVLFGYEVSAITVAEWGEGVYSIFAIFPYVIGCLLLAAQGVARISMGRRP